MRSFLWKRMGTLLGSVLLLSLLFYFLLEKSPGNPYMQSLRPGMTTEEIQAKLRSEGALDPLPVKLARYYRSLFTDGFGTSIKYKTPVMRLILSRLPNTLIVSGISFLIAVALSLVLGAFSVAHKDGFWDGVIGFFTFAFHSLPTFLPALFLLRLFIVRLGWFALSDTSRSALFQGRAATYVLPIATLAIVTTAGFLRQIRSILLAETEKPYFTTAQAMGKTKLGALYADAMLEKRSVLCTIYAVELPGIVSGALITETIFRVPGIGRLGFEALLNRDIPVVMALLILTSGITLFTYLVLDVFVPKEAK